MNLEYDILQISRYPLQLKMRWIDYLYLHQLYSDNETPDISIRSKYYEIHFFHSCLILNEGFFKNVPTGQDFFGSTYPRTTHLQTFSSFLFSVHKGNEASQEKFTENIIA